jgi:hypothetical protein
MDAKCLWVLAGRTADLRGQDSWLAHNYEPFTADDTKGGDRVGDVYLAGPTIGTF